MATKSVTLANYEDVADTKDSAVTFTSGDCADANASSWTSVNPLETGETHASLFNKISTMLKNVRYLYKKLGTTDISSIGDGTVTDAISKLNSKTTGSGTATNQYGSCTYNWTRRANVVVVTVDYTPSTNVTNSSGGFTLSNIPTPSQSVYDASVDRSTPTTIYGASELNTGKTCTFYGTRVSGKTYNASFTYIAN